MRLIGKSGIDLHRVENDTPDDERNVLVHEEKTYILRDLVEGKPRSKGGNSTVYTLHDPAGIDFAIKISRVYGPLKSITRGYRQRYGRFMAEIEALQKCSEGGCESVVQILGEGTVTVEGREFPYYIMEKAQFDLKEFLLRNLDVDDQNRVELCFGVHRAIQQLHDMGYYHRDIKPDNILFFGSSSNDEEENPTWKIGDLGLIEARNKDNLDRTGERIGPFGWISPEAGNKFMTEEYSIGLDCTIDEKSDVFQLGKLMWFIFQNNIPIGIIERADLTRDFPHADQAFSTVFRALQHSKTRRYDMEQMGRDLQALASAYGVA